MKVSVISIQFGPVDFAFLPLPFDSALLFIQRMGPY